MASTFDVAGLRVAPGTRAAGWIQIARMPASGTIGIPVVVLHGNTDGPVVVVDAATHGDEYEGTLSLLRLLKEIDPRALRGTLIGVPVLNGPSFDAEVRGNPLERHHYDLNRAYPGEAGGSITQRIAAKYFSEVVKRADAVISLHGGGNVFYLDGFVIAHTTAGNSLALIKAWGWKRFTDNPDVALNPYQGTLHQKCAEIGIPSITVELGGGSHRSPDHLRRIKGEFVRGLRNILIHYGLLEGQPDRPDTIWKIKKQNLRVNDGGIMDLDEGIDIEASVDQGQRLITVYDPLGNVVEEIKAPYAGRVMGLPASPLAYPGRIAASVYQIIEEVPIESRR
jgi:predicted deacylase